MSSVKLNDIWRSVNNEIGFYTSETFKDVPNTPGVYAWFYPLRILTKDIYEFINEVNAILDYDGIREAEIDFKWEIITQNLEIKSKKINLTPFEGIWSEIITNGDDTEFNELRKIIMRASILLPPLYIGKTRNLNIRCQQHVNTAGGKNNFRARFEKYADEAYSNKKISKKIEVNDLLFVAIKTKEEDQLSTRTEELVESILKHLSKPKYSEK